jgi:predicted hexulose-6-phosphate isomerase
MNRSYCLGLYEKAMPTDLSWSEKFFQARKAGYDYLEISIDETEERLARLDWSGRERKNLAFASEGESVALGSICLSGHRKYPLGGSDGRNLEIMKKAIDFACSLGIPVIQLAGYDVYYETSTPATVERFLKNLAISTEMAAKCGILLGFETMETPFMDTVGKAMEYVRAIDSPYLGVYPDLGNLTNASLLYGKTVCEDLETGRGHMLAAHIKETVPGKYREIPFGTGHVDFSPVLQKTWELGVRRYVTELWCTPSNPWQEAVEHAGTFARTILDSLQE